MVFWETTEILPTFISVVVTYSYIPRVYHYENVFECFSASPIFTVEYNGSLGDENQWIHNESNFSAFMLES